MKSGYVARRNRASLGHRAPPPVRGDPAIHGRKGLLIQRAARRAGGCSLVSPATSRAWKRV